MKSRINILRRRVRLKIFGKDRFVPLFVVLMAIGLVVAVLLIRHMLLRDEWTTLSVEWHGYSIEHPALWGTKTYPTSGGRGENLDYLSATISSFGLSVFIYQTELEEPNLTDALEWGQDIILGWEPTDFSSPVEVRIGIDNYPALMQSYYDGNDWNRAYIVATENRAYMIEFTRVSEGSRPIIEQMIASFRLLDEDTD